MSTKLAVYDKIINILQDVTTVNRHSYFQIKYFIIGKEPTHQAKLWRCVKELEVRADSLKALRMELDDGIDNLKIMEIGLKRLERDLSVDPLDIEERAIQIRKRQRHKLVATEKLTNLQKKVKETEEESAIFLESFNMLQKKEALKPYDDLESQTEMWNEKISQEFNLRGLLGLPVDLELAKTTLALENNVPIKQKFINKLQEITNIKIKLDKMEQE
jgi:hypothetical protein